ncbi:UvrD-helicase domain-containing protein [Desulforegula conservatrix]|uniref:UvrD-helicase domain-containing protein n=1 Tax=Desulforegula conservatrix TaxID=153026 RepID=UPI000404B4AB|nr:UvrD-helicase domain-containing protein [Desulforegula conservatrix]
MRFIADLHIHSRFSMATASNLNLENLYISARKKGITVVGTGDFTHPEWYAEMKERLIPAEDGLYRLKPDLEDACDRLVPESCRGPVRFMLQAEISSIYKKDGKVRKNHNLLYFPTLESVSRFNSRLSAIGNIKSDGRPILGLDSRDLLEILFETDDKGFMIPAHIWTPWFSLLGSKSGFDSIEECFGDLSKYIFAAETGLSSDPAMNHRVSFLDKISLVSNSDAHSPGKLGREANLFDTDLSYTSIRSALETGDPSAFLGTLEFFPEEGKYHMDGHRKCGIRFSPEESLKTGGICPECGGKMTLGVLYRVEELADRNDGVLPEKAKPYHSIIPLTDIIAEIFRVGPLSKKVNESYARIIDVLGPELDILYSMDIEKIRKADIPLLGLAIEKMRSHDIVLLPGYDGEFGTVKIFTDDERRTASGQKFFFDIKDSEKKSLRNHKPEVLKQNAAEKTLFGKIEADNKLKKNGAESPTLNDEQARAVTMKPCHMIITAGPGTGKTRTITHRISHLISDQGVNASEIVAITFTNRAADEMRQRLKSLLPGKEIPFTGTFHGLCFSILREAFPEKKFCIIDQDQRAVLIRSAMDKYMDQISEKIKKPDFNKVSEYITMMKHPVSEKEESGSGDKLILSAVLGPVFLIYQDLLESKDLLDFDDLVFKSIKLFEENPLILEKWHEKLRFVFIDEYQDLNNIQYHFIRLLCGSSCHVCAIGDPDQSIYGFRGGSSEYFGKFAGDFSGAEELRLVKNYRSSKTILDASFQMIRKGGNDSGQRVFSDIEAKKSISIFKGNDEYREASTIVAEIEKLVGGTSSLSIHSGRAGDDCSSAHAFSDFAILYRTRVQAEAIMAELERSGIPFQPVNKDNFLLQPLISESLKCLSAALGLNVSRPEYLSLMSESALKKISEQALSGKIVAALNSARAHLIENEHLGIASDSSGWDRLLEIAGAYPSDPFLFLSDIALMSDQDVYSKKSQKVSLMTLHASKGLEFPVVFIAGCEKDLLPYNRPGAEVCVDEERRLFFVGMTRAKESLYLSWAANRRVFGRKTERFRSPFLDDIEERLLEFSRTARKAGRKESAGKQLELF